MEQVEDVLPRFILFSVIILLGAVLGALWPMYTERKSRHVAFLSFAAGVMLGAVFFHMLPEAYRGSGPVALTYALIGFVMMFVLERYVIAHVCEEPPDCEEHAHAVNGVGLAAFLGLSVHTLFDGIALGSSLIEGIGFSTFIAITAHKIPSSLSLAAILKTERKSRAAILGYIVAFGLMVPLGAVIYFVLNSNIRFDAMAAKAIAFSSGTFLYIAVSDLLPYVNRHGKDGRPRSILTLAVGMLIMFALTRIHGHAELR